MKLLQSTCAQIVTSIAAAAVLLTLLYLAVFGTPPEVSAYRQALKTLDRDKNKQELGRLYIKAMNADQSFQWKTPIDFYGMIVDEENKPVAGAHVEFVWTDTSLEGTSKTSAASDTGGKFLLTGVRGKRLTVTIDKVGYRAPRTQNQFSFEYANCFEKRFHQPDPKQPVMFHLLKTGVAEPMIHRSFNINLKLDGSPVTVNLFSGKTGQEGQMEVRKWRSETWWQDRKNGLKFGWRVLFRIPDGGLVDMGKEMAYTAPVSGYSPDFDINLPKSGQTWSTAVRKKLCFEFGTPLKYGRMEFDADSVDNFVSITLWINPSGSRNLEYDPSKDITQQFDK